MKPTTTEFLLYGLRKGETERYTEELLTTGNLTRCETIQKLAGKDGFHSFRIAKFDGSPPNFYNVLNK